MTRKLFYIGFSFLAGAIISSFFSIKLNCCIGAAAFFILLLSIIFLHGITRKKLTLILLTFIMAIAQNVIFTNYIYNPIISLDGEKVSLEGKIVEIREYESGSMLLTVNGIVNNQFKTNVNFFTAASNYEYDDTIYVQGVARKATDSLRYRREYYGKINGTYIEITNIEYIQLTKNEAYSFQKSILKLRDTVFSSIITALPGDNGALLGAMLCGDKSSLSDASSSAMFRSGIGHIAAVSGTHLVLITSFFAVILYIFKAGKIVSFILTEALVWSFAIFAGMSSSVIRSAIMMTLVLSAGVLRRRYDFMTALGVCSVIMLAGNPYGALSASFLLSMTGAFSASVSSHYFLSNIKFNRFDKLKRTFLANLCICVCVFPVTVVLFNEVSIVAPIANLLLIPLCSLALIITLIGTIFIPIGFVYTFIMKIAGLIATIVLKLAAFFSSLPFAALHTGNRAFRFACVVLSLAIICLVILKQKRRVVVISICASFCIALGIFCCGVLQDKDITRIAVISDDKSMILLLYNNRNSVIINCMGNGDNAVVCERFMQKYGINSLDTLVLYSSSQASAKNFSKELSCEINRLIVLDGEEVRLEGSEVRNTNKLFLSVLNGKLDIRSGRIIFEFGNNSVIYFSDRKTFRVNDETVDLSFTENGETILFEFGSKITSRRLSYALN